MVMVWARYEGGEWATGVGMDAAVVEMTETMLPGSRGGCVRLLPYLYDTLRTIVTSSLAVRAPTPDPQNVAWSLS